MQAGVHACTDKQRTAAAPQEPRPPRRPRSLTLQLSQRVVVLVRARFGGTGGPCRGEGPVAVKSDLVLCGPLAGDPCHVDRASRGKGAGASIRDGLVSRVVCASFLFVAFSCGQTHVLVHGGTLDMGPREMSVGRKRGQFLPATYRLPGTWRGLNNIRPRTFHMCPSIKLNRPGFPT